MTFWVGLAGLLGLIAGAAIWNLALARAAGWGAVRGGRSWAPLLGAATPGASRATLTRATLFQLGVALYYALLVIRHGEDPGWVVSVILFSVPLLILLLVDAWTRLIHTNIIAAGLLLALVSATLEGFPELGRAAAGGLVGLALFGVFYMVARLISDRTRVVPFGLGDVYLATMIGAMVRFDRVFFALFAGLVLAGLASLLLLLIRRSGARRPLSFGPFLCAGALLALAI
jgi:leader peptidase (prepilin peptidase)/N-methyltransferase